MLDYGLIGYRVEFRVKGAVLWDQRNFYTEEEAIAFVKAERKNWRNYRLVRIQSAIIDF